MTGLEAYDSLMVATRELPYGSEFRIHILDHIDLRKLRPGDLEARRFEPPVADRVSGDLLQNNFASFEQSIGIRLIVDNATPRLTPPTQSKSAE